VRNARKTGKRIKLTDERIAAFDAMGFVWTFQEYVTRSFDERIKDLMEYCAQVRHSLKQPEKNGTIKLTEERISRLDALGFKWRNA